MDLWTYEREQWNQGFDAVCGVDEAGAGPLAGPVYAAAVILPRELDIPGLNDSKKLTEKKRETLFDIITIDTELALADLEAVLKALDRANRAAKANDKEALARKPVLEKLAAVLDQGRSARSAGLDAEERALVRDMFLITLKPLMYIANVAEDGFENNPHLDVL